MYAKKFISIVFIFIFISSPILAQTIDSKVVYRACNINIDWWDNFSDPYLKKYVYIAMEKNHELKKISYITEQYRQTIKTTMSKEFPSLMFAPTFARIKTAQNQIFDIDTATIRTNNYALPLIAKYEADIFLKNHDKTKSSKKEYDSYKYKEKAADISLASDVATIYINILKLDKVINTQEKVNDIREKILELTKERYKEGLASLYDVTYTDKLHTQSQIEINDLKRQRSLLLHQLAVYIDDCPSNSENLERGSFENLEFKGQIPQQITSNIVFTRPDIMKAESDLEKAKIDIKIARKEFLPTIPILGIAGYNALLLKDLFNWNNIFGLVGVSAMQKIFTGGMLSANLKTKKLKYQELFEAYKQADLTAIQEINDALCLIKYDSQKDRANLKKLNLETSNYKLIQERYKSGIDSFLSLIQYEENLLSIQKEKDNSKAQRLIDYITLYKATGAKL